MRDTRVSRLDDEGTPDWQSRSESRSVDPLVEAVTRVLVFGFLLACVCMFLGAVSLWLLRLLQPLHEEDGLFLALAQSYSVWTHVIVVGGFSVLLVGLVILGVSDICRWLAD